MAAAYDDNDDSWNPPSTMLLIQIIGFIGSSHSSITVISII
jgi:hypothetical protein